MNATQTQLLGHLQTAYESTSTEQDGSVFGCVYLDNARAKMSLNPRQFAQALSTLKKAGLYRDSDDRQYNGTFGYVKLTDEQVIAHKAWSASFREGN